MQTAICLLLVVFFLLMNAFFVIAEFALVRVRKSQIDMAVAEKRRGAEAARDVTTHINAYLSACQLGITLASLAIGWLGEPAVSAVLEAPLLSWGFPEATVYPICVAVGFFIVTTLHVVVGELIPKSFAIFATEKYALHTAGPLRVFYRITYPIMVIFNGITNGVMRLFGHDPADEHEVYTGEEIKLLIDESTESGLIDPEQNEFVDNIFDLGDKDAEGIMTPRTDVICLDLEDTLEENWDVVRQYKYTRYPVCDGSKDRIVGFVHTKDLVDEPKDAPMSDWKIRELPPVPEGAPIAKLLQAMQEGRTEMCVVVDEHGGTAGIVTMSDLLEQLVGDLDDSAEHEPVLPEIEPLDSGTWRILGSAPLAHVAKALHVNLPVKEYDTFGGFVFACYGFVPEDGAEFELDACGLHIHVTQIQGHKLQRAVVCRETPPHDP